MGDRVCDHPTYSEILDRLLEYQVGEDFFAEVSRWVDRQGLMSKTHVPVDGTRILVRASPKSLRLEDGSDNQAPGGADATPRPVGRTVHAASSPAP